MAARLSSLLGLATLLVGSDAIPNQPRTGGGYGECKAFPGTSSWPTERSWAAFNATVGGNLIRPLPPGGVCHPGQPNYIAGGCASLAEEWLTYDFHQDDPVSSMWNQYNNDTCLPDRSAPCSSAGYPAYVVNATNADTVSKSLVWARKHNVRVIVKSTGHDYQGRSSAPGALSIWVHHMQDFETLDSFQPKGCDFTIDGTAITAQGGTQMQKIYDGLDEIGQAIVGGGSKSVSVGGYVTGAGHSIIAPRYGLAADNVWEMEIVTPMGNIVTANECQNQDLFWAMRGGGGSTFGVMTSVTMATHPTPKMLSTSVLLGTSDLEAPWIWDMIGYILSQWPSLDSQGVSGYSFVSSNQTIPTGQPNVTFSGAGMMGSFVLLDTDNPEDANKVWQPIIDHVNATWGNDDGSNILASVQSTPYASFSKWFEVNYDQGSAGANAYAGSRLLDEAAFKDPKRLGEAYSVFAGQQGGSAFLVSGDGVRNAKPRGGGNAVNPAWRTSVSHATNGQGWLSFDPAAKARAIEELNVKIQPLRDLTPGGGAYMNEAHVYEPDWQQAFWGDHYERLAAIKKKVDPFDVMWCQPCVGSEGWKQIGYKLCRVGGGYPHEEM